MVAFCNCRSFVVVSFLSCAAVFAQNGAKSTPSSLEKAAGQFVALLDKGEFDKATATFDAAMLQAMPPDALKSTWEKILAQAGAFKKQSGTWREKSGNYEIVNVTCEFAKMKLDTRVVFDADEKIAGLSFRPPRQPTPAGVEQVWEGKLDVGGAELPLVFHLFKQKNGKFVGTMDSPDQGAKGILLDEVSVKDNAVRLELKSAKFVFEAQLAKDGREMTGDFKQAGQTFPLTLKKTAKAKESKPPTSRKS